jgi:hypothetical protein
VVSGFSEYDKVGFCRAIGVDRFGERSGCNEESQKRRIAQLL